MNSGPTRLYVAFDDTDNLGADRGTGKVARWFEDELPEECSLWGVARLQLPVDDAIPFTSHNSSACCLIDVAPNGRRIEDIASDVVERGIAHLDRYALPGSDPGLCVAWEGCEALPALRAFGRLAAQRVVTQASARVAAAGAHLSGHGGANDGIIGAAAGVGLAAEGNCGRLIEYRWAGGLLRDFTDPLTVADLEAAGIAVVAIDRDAPVPSGEQLVHTDGWMRPRLWAGRPVLPVQRETPDSDAAWRSLGPRTRQPTE